MLDKNTLIKAKNRSYGGVGYDVPDLGIKRRYEPNEVKTVTMEELTKLSYSIGGKRIIEKYLILDNKEAVEELLGEVNPEYFYTTEDIITLLTKGSLDQLLDCMDFAEESVVDNIKKLAVDLEINDNAKRDAIFEKTGFNVNNAIALKRAEKAEDEKNGVQEETVAKRRTAPITEIAQDETPQRRTASIKSSGDFEIMA